MPSTFSLPNKLPKILYRIFLQLCGEKKMRFLSLPSFRTYLYNSIRNDSLNYLEHQNVESLSILNAWQALIEKSQKKKIPMKKKYTDYYFVLSINCQHAAGKYSYYIWMEKKNEEIATALGIFD